MSRRSKHTTEKDFEQKVRDLVQQAEKSKESRRELLRMHQVPPKTSILDGSWKTDDGEGQQFAVRISNEGICLALKENDGSGEVIIYDENGDLLYEFGASGALISELVQEKAVVGA